MQQKLQNDSTQQTTQIPSRPRHRAEHRYQGSRKESGVELACASRGQNFWQSLVGGDLSTDRSLECLVDLAVAALSARTSTFSVSLASSLALAANSPELGVLACLGESQVFK